MTTTEAIKQLQTEHDLIAQEYDLDGSQFAPALLEALAMAIEVLKCSEIPNCSEPKCADGCIYGWGSSECGHCDYRSEDVLKSLPPAQPEQRWIPVSKELPDDLDEVNITWINNDPEPYYDFVKGKAFTGSAVFYKGDWYWYSSVTVDVLAEYGRCDTEKMDKGIKVTAWMPLPEPYEGDDHAD